MSFAVVIHQAQENSIAPSLLLMIRCGSRFVVWSAFHVLYFSIFCRFKLCFATLRLIFVITASNGSPRNNEVECRSINFSFSFQVITCSFPNDASFFTIREGLFFFKYIYIYYPNTLYSFPLFPFVC